MFYSICLIHIKGTRESEMLTCYREDFLKLPLKLQLCVLLSVHLRGGQGKNTAHLSGIVKGNLQHGTSSLRFLHPDQHQHSFPHRLRLDLPKHMGSVHRSWGLGRIPAFTFGAQRVGSEVNFAFWPTNLKDTAVASS